MKRKRIIAVDVGNSSAKFGLFESCNDITPVAVWVDDPRHLDKHDECFLPINAMTECERPTRAKQPFQNHWIISSVSPLRLEKVLAPMRQHYPDDSVVILKQDDILLKSNVFSREKLGIDRLIAAYAGWKWVQSSLTECSQQPILVADFGTAITIDLVSPQGCFEGGAIYPSFALSSQSLQEGTAQLPEIDLDSLGLLQYPGRNTESAIGVALLWGVVGLIRQIAEQVEEDDKTSTESAVLHSREGAHVSSMGRTKGPPPVVILTGGGAATVFPFLKPYFPENRLHYLPHLVLTGIALTRQLGKRLHTFRQDHQVLFQAFRQTEHQPAHQIPDPEM